MLNPVQLQAGALQDDGSTAAMAKPAQCSRLTLYMYPAAGTMIANDIKNDYVARSLLCNTRLHYYGKLLNYYKMQNVMICSFPCFPQRNRFSCYAEKEMVNFGGVIRATQPY